MIELDPKKNGCWNCKFRDVLLCQKHKVFDWMILHLEILGRPVDEEQLKIPLTEEENKVCGSEENETGRLFGEECPNWKKRRPFIFR